MWAPTDRQNELAGLVIGAVIEVHKEIGPGYIEHPYEEALAVEKILPVFEAQVISYLKRTKISLGLLINFNVPLLKEGIRRIVYTSSQV